MQPQGTYRTLVVDDDPFSLQLLARQLERLGHGPVTLCQRAWDALRALEENGDTIGLVFCDLQMPEIDGVEFVRHLANRGYRGDLVLVSGEDVRILQTVQNLARGHGIRLTGALRKPIGMEDLRQVLSMVGASRSEATPAAPEGVLPDELRHAIVSGELVNHYQPKVSLSNGALVGVEALVRWQHPRMGLIYPDQFVAEAENRGLIDELTHAVLAKALSDTFIWRNAGLALQIAVNISMDNLATLDFPDMVARLARSAGVPLSALILEVTESRFMSNALAPLDTLARLRLKRVGLSIDDFGTGHSSLAQLRDLPFDELKIDQGFVRGCAHDATLRAIVLGSLNMAHELGMHVVAEGVEDRSDWDFVREAGCDAAQGYYISKPMPAEALLDWAKLWGN